MTYNSRVWNSTEAEYFPKKHPKGPHVGFRGELLKETNKNAFRLYSGVYSSEEIWSNLIEDTLQS